MATTTRAERKNTSGLSRDQLVGAYRTMLLSRRMDDKEIQLKRQNKIFFQISGAGHEAVLTAAGMVLQPGVRLVLSLLSRPRALPRARHDRRRRCCYEAVGAARDPELGRPPDAEPLGHKKLNIVSASSPTGTQFLQAVGSRRGDRCARSCSTSPTGSRTTRSCSCSTGDGTTSEGEFWESLNTASQSQAAGRLSRRGQRLRDLGPGRGQHRRRQHLEARRVVPRTSSSRKWTAAICSRATRRCSARSTTRASERVRRSCTRT